MEVKGFAWKSRVNLANLSFYLILLAVVLGKGVPVVVTPVWRCAHYVGLGW